RPVDHERATERERGAICGRRARFSGRRPPISRVPHPLCESQQQSKHDQERIAQIWGWLLYMQHPDWRHHCEWAPERAGERGGNEAIIDQSRGRVVRRAEKAVQNRKERIAEMPLQLDGPWERDECETKSNAQTVQ